VKFLVDWAFDCSCYGTTEVSASSLEECAAKVKLMYEKDELFQNWEARPELGMTDPRIVLIVDEATTEVVDDGFPLREYSPQEAAPLDKHPHLVETGVLSDGKHNPPTYVVTLHVDKMDTPFTAAVVTLRRPDGKLGRVEFTVCQTATGYLGRVKALHFDESYDKVISGRIPLCWQENCGAFDYPVGHPSRRSDQ